MYKAIAEEVRLAFERSPVTRATTSNTSLERTREE